MDTYTAPLELKFADNAPAGEFSGYAAVFGNVDGHGDVILPGAFGKSLAGARAAGRTIPMHVMHRGRFGGDGLPVGVWRSVEEDDRGLRVEGKISGATNTDHGRLLFERVRDGALGGLSVGYKIAPNGASYGKKAGEPKRTLKSLDLTEISLVDDPSNPLTRVSEVKNTPAVDLGSAVESLAEAMLLCKAAIDPEAEDAEQFSLLQAAHLSLTGSPMPEGIKRRPQTVREFEKLLRDGGFSHAEARAFAEHGWKAAPRDEADEQAAVAVKTLSALEEFERRLNGISLPTLK